MEITRNQTGSGENAVLQPTTEPLRRSKPYPLGSRARMSRLRIQIAATLGLARICAARGA